MSKKEIEIINNEWAKDLNCKGIKNYMVYSPFENYWNEKYKIMVCNLETYGYQDCEVSEVNLGLMKQWMTDTHITKTSRYTSVFIHALQKAKSGKKLTNQEIRKSYYQFDNLVEAMNKISYMNFRKESNERVNQDINAIIREVKANKDFLKRFILACEPDILFVGGKIGVNSFNSIFEPESKLLFNSEIEYEGIRIVSINHLSRMRYAYVESKIDSIID